MFKKTILIALAAFTILASCKKDKDTVKERLEGTWKIESLVVNDYFGGSLSTDTYVGTSADFVEFRSNGEFYSSVDGVANLSEYGIVNDNSIWIDDASTIYTIQTLTATTFRLYSKETVGSDYYEVILNLKK